MGAVSHSQPVQGAATAHEIDYKIHGDDMQAVQIILDSGAAVHAEAGAMLFIEADIEMDTGTQGERKGVAGFGGDILRGFLSGD